MRINAAICLALGLLLLTAASCVTYYDPWEVRASNRERLNLLAPGMTKSEVLEIMGTESMPGDDAEINNPFRSELFTHDSTTYEVLYYYTDKKIDDNAITDDELTPIVFRDGVLHGWGWISLRQVEQVAIGPEPVAVTDPLP